MKKSGQLAINEIIERIRSGACRMRSIKVYSPKDLPVVMECKYYDRWIPVCSYHKSTVRAASNLLRYRFDSVLGIGLYEVAA